MVPTELTTLAARRRLVVIGWEANCERVNCVWGLLPRPPDNPPADLIAAIQRARELPPELERLHCAMPTDKAVITVPVDPWPAGAEGNSSRVPPSMQR